MPSASGTAGVLSLDRLAKEIVVDRLNRSVHVSAGVRLSNRDAELARQSATALIVPANASYKSSVKTMNQAGIMQFAHSLGAKVGVLKCGCSRCASCNSAVWGSNLRQNC